MKCRAGRTIEPAHSTVDRMLASISGANPKSVALITDGREFTYSELSAEAERFAAGLHARGIGRGSRVGLCLPRGRDLLVAMLGVIRSGAAYVPLDPVFPKERLAYMMSDARLALLVSQAALAGESGWTEATCPLLDASEPLGVGASAGLDSALLAQPEDPLYLLYTSGSTGRPKGVNVPHRAVTNFLSSMQVEPGVCAQDRILAITTLSFDISVLELLLPWTVGASVVLARAEEAIDGDWLRRSLDLYGITLLQATPGTWRILMGAGWLGTPDLKALVGGEALPPDLATKLLERCREVWNMYGPTETTVWSTCWKVSSPLEAGISIGGPIANTTVCLLNPDLTPCATGEAGEICIGGAGVAIGYFDQPTLTSERFVTISDDAGKPMRVYRTGDLGRWRANGELDHLGRLDEQIKLRGFRIEPGEIEARLCTHPNVGQALVTMREGPSGSKLLVAYLVGRGMAPDAATLREFLRSWLPDYMVPQAFVTLDFIPLLPNGKTDRRRLPAPEFLPEPKTSLARTNATMEALLRIWQETLGIPQVGPEDSFFDLGGDSLLALRAIKRIQSELHRPCPLPLFFRASTVARLAEALDRREATADRQVMALQPGGVEPPLFCICGIQLYQHLADDLGPDIPVYGVFVPSELHYMMPQGIDRRRSIGRLVSEYIDLIRSQQPHGPYRLAGFSFGGVVAYEIAQQLTRAGEPVTFLALLDSDVPNLRAHTWDTRIGRLLLRIRQWGKRTARRMRPGKADADQLLMLTRERVLQAAMHRYAADEYAGDAIYIEADEAEHDRPGYDWRRLIPRLTVYRLPGDHMDLLTEPGVRRVAQIFASQMRQS